VITLTRPTPTPLRVYDREAVFAKRVAGRRVVYLDHNVWIDLRDAKTPEARAALSACQNAVACRHAIFPVSYSAISELFHVPSPSDRRAHADLMDALARGMTFRLPDVVLGIEAEAVSRHLLGLDPIRPDRRNAFGCLPFYTGDENLPVLQQMPSAIAARYVRDFRRRLENRWARYLVEEVDVGQIRRNHANNYASRMDACRDAQWQRLSDGRRIDRERVLGDERAALFEKHVRPALNSIVRSIGLAEGTRRLASYRERNGDWTPRRYREVFSEYAPSLEVACQLFVGRIVQRDRRSEEQDFWDLEHAFLPPVYADAFVTMDRNLAGLVRMGKQRPRAARVEVLATLGALSEWLRAPAASPSSPS
jgi:hypothetical protein